MAPPQSRSKLYSIGAISLAVGLALFLVLFPAVEREAFLAQIRDPDSTKWSSAMLHLCWIEPGRDGLDASLPELGRQHRLGVLAEAQDVGCLDMLEPSLAAEYWIWQPEAASATQSAIGYGRSAIEPAFAALESERPAVVDHALQILSALDHELSEDQNDRLESARREAMGPSEVPPQLADEPAPTSRSPAADPAADPAAGDFDAETDDVPDSNGRAAVPSEFPELDLRLDEPTLRARNPGVLFAADPDEKEPRAEAQQDEPEEPEVELAPPPVMPEPDAGGDRVE